MFDSPAYSQGIEVSGVSSTVYIGGQNSVDKDGNIVGKGDFALQCRQALTNVKTVLEAADCTVDNLVKLTIYYVKGNDPRLGFAAFQEVFGLVSIPPTITVVEVHGLGVPDYLIEVDAIAVN